MNCREKKFKKKIKKNVTPTPPTTPNFKVTKHKVKKSISGMQLSWAKPGNPREAGTNRREERGRRREGGGEGPERSRVAS